MSDSLRPHGFACHATLSMGLCGQESWSGLPFPSPGDLPDLGTEPGSPELQADHLPSEPTVNLTGLYPTECEFYCVQSLSHIQRFGTAKSCKLTSVCQASLSFTVSWSLLKLVSIELVMLSNHFIFCRPLLLLPSICPSIKVFSSESALHIRWPQYWSFSFSISPSNENNSGHYWSLNICLILLQVALTTSPWAWY